MQPPMSAKKLFHGRALMPTRTVHLEPDRITPRPPVEVSQDLQKSFPISSRRRDHAAPPQQRSHPPRKIQPRVMATGGGNSQPLPAFGPTPAQSRMQGETGLVL